MIDSDGTRDTNKITDFINKNNDFILSVTYDSIDIIQKCLTLFNNPLFIIDEFHNLSKSNVCNKEDDFYKLLYSDHKILFISATPRIYELENNEELDEDIILEDEESYQETELKTNDIDHIFGNVIYNMSFNEAIEKKYITDYRIWLPCISENIDDLDKELSIYDIDINIKNKCKYLYSCLLNNGSKKCIIYCINTSEIDIMMKAMNELNTFYCLDIYMNKITSSNSYKSRSDILQKFQEDNENIQLLFSVRILDECIDVPSCDSIYITYSTTSKIRTIQRISRCIRIDKNNPYKIGNIYIWCDKYDEILDTISGIKEYDIFFKDKIKLNENNFYGERNNKELILNKNKVINDYIINIKEYKYKNWFEKLEEVKQYIDTHNKIPLSTDKNKNIKNLSNWLYLQKYNYINNNMKNINIKNTWENFIDKYKDFINDTSRKDKWYENLRKLQNYIEEYGKLPSTTDSNKNIQSISFWYTRQMINYKKNIDIMKKEPSIKVEWINFMEYLQNSSINKIILWKNNLEKLKQHIIKYHKQPLIRVTQDNDINMAKLGTWLSDQKKMYKKNASLMKNPEIKLLFEQFLEEYKDFLK